MTFQILYQTVHGLFVEISRSVSAEGLGRIGEKKMIKTCRPKSEKNKVKGRLKKR